MPDDPVFQAQVNREGEMVLGLVARKGRGCTSSGGENYLDLPPCEFKLKTAKGIATYQTLAKLFSDAGKLTTEMHLRLSRYVLAADTIHAYQAHGRSLRASMFDQLRRAEKDLGLEELVRPPSPPQPMKINKFAHCGFTNRPRRAP